MASPTALFRFVCVLCFLNYYVNSKWIDMTYPFNEKTLYWGKAEFEHNVIFVGSLKINNSTVVPYYASYNYAAAEHGGTHMDAPIHFAKGRWSVDKIPVENLVGDAVVVNISGKAAVDRDAQLTVEDLLQWQEKHGAIPDDSILFVFSDWGKYYEDYEKTFGTNTTNTSLYRFPGIHEQAAMWLVKNTKIKGVGIDTPSVDYGKSKTFPTHQILYAKNIYGLENVANLDKLPATGYKVWALPMKIGGGSGGPVRILATEQDTRSGAEFTSATASGLFAVILVAAGIMYVIY